MKLFVPELYTRVRPLFRALDFNLVVDSILSGFTRGSVYADSFAEPAAALVWSQMDTVLLGGAPQGLALSHHVNTLLRQQLMPAARARYIPHFTFYPAPSWQEQLDVVLDGFEPQEVARQAFAFAAPAFDWRAATPPGLRVAALEPALLAFDSWENMKAVRGWVDSFWSTPEDFARHGVGFCLLDGEKVCSWCISVYATEHALELGVETAPAYRGQGFASLVAAAAVEASVDRQQVPHWHCDLDNKPSVRLAEKIGFRRAAQYTVLRLPFSEG